MAPPACDHDHGAELPWLRLPVTMITGLNCHGSATPFAVFVVTNYYFGVLTLAMCVYFAFLL
jgi:hypothetical protein